MFSGRLTFRSGGFFRRHPRQHRRPVVLEAIPELHPDPELRSERYQSTPGRLHYPIDAIHDRDQFFFEPVLDQSRPVRQRFGSTRHQHAPVMDTGGGAAGFDRPEPQVAGSGKRQHVQVAVGGRQRQAELHVFGFSSPAVRPCGAPACGVLDLCGMSAHRPQADSRWPDILFVQSCKPSLVGPFWMRPARRFPDVREQFQSAHDHEDHRHGIRQKPQRDQARSNRSNKPENEPVLLIERMRENTIGAIVVVKVVWCWLVLFERYPGCGFPGLKIEHRHIRRFHGRTLPFNPIKTFIELVESLSRPSFPCPFCMAHRPHRRRPPCAPFGSATLAGP